MPPKKNKKKIEVKVEETIINYDIPLKPDDQLVLSQEVRIKIIKNIIDNNGQFKIGVYYLVTTTFGLQCSFDKRSFNGFL